MIKQLRIHQFTFIQDAVLDFESGMIVLTGDTGAGKSTVLEALGLLLGERADPQLIKTGTASAEISAILELEVNSEARLYLASQAFENEQEPTVCVLRRVLHQTGKSMAFVNGKPATLTQLKELAGHWIHVHGQHAHHALLKSSLQREYVDHFGAHQDLLSQVLTAFLAWEDLKDQRQDLEFKQGQKMAEENFLRYQLEELQSLQLRPNECEELQVLERRLRHSQHLQSTADQVCRTLQDDESAIMSSVRHLQHQLQDATKWDPTFAPLSPMLEEVSVNLREIYSVCHRYRQSETSDLEQLTQIQERLDRLYQVARKHRLEPPQLFELQESLLQKLHEFDSLDRLFADLQVLETEARQAYLNLANQLSEKRRSVAKTMVIPILKALSQLGMPHAQLDIRILAVDPHRLGLDQVEFWMATNLGQNLQPLRDIVSGGELSRLSLVIHSLTVERKGPPTLVFDEVDVGIGGATGEVVGQLLQNLGKQTQVLCITHLAQVAAKGSQHWHVRKSTDAGQTHIHIESLSGEARVEELARMLGGLKITPALKAHAQELINS